MAGLNGIDGVNGLGFWANLRVNNAKYGAMAGVNEKQAYKGLAQSFNTGVYNLNHPRHDGVTSPRANVLDITG